MQYCAAAGVIQHQLSAAALRLLRLLQQQLGEGSQCSSAAVLLFWLDAALRGCWHRVTAAGSSCTAAAESAAAARGRLSVSIDAVLMLAGCRAVRLRASIDISWQQLHCGC
jgi:hypothetical protein